MTSAEIWILLAVLMLLSWGALVRRQRRRWRQPYVAARARIEGGGVKRGLTPPEGAILLGRPLNVALTLVILDLLRKGFVSQVNATPLVVEVVDVMRTRGEGLSAPARTERRLRAAQALHKPMHNFEEAFLEIIESSPDTPVHQIDYSIAIQPLVRYVAGRVGGYDLEDTRQYYELIIDRAPREARSDGVLTTERQKVFDRNFGWVLLGAEFAEVLDSDDYSYAPVWLRDEAGSKRAGVIEGQSFAEWVQDLFMTMEAAVPAGAILADLDRESDLTAATLMRDISQATYYS